MPDPYAIDYDDDEDVVMVNDKDEPEVKEPPLEEPKRTKPKSKSKSKREVMSPGII